MRGGAVISLPVLGAAIAGTLVVGFLIGSLHAWLITVVRLPPFIATLATLVGLRSFAWAICENVTKTTLGGRSSQIQIYDERFRYLATSVWIPAVLFVVLALVAWLILGKTVLGRHLYALGGNEEAARLSGIRTDRIKWFAYCASAVLSSIAGILYICEVSVADPTTLGLGYELNAIAAAVVGGCSLQGGVGTIGGTVLGTIFLRTVIDGVAKVIKTGSKVYEGLIVGLVVVFAVAFSQTSRLRGREGFFAGPLGFVAAINLALIFGVMMVLVGPTLAEGWTTLDGSILGAWAGGSIFFLLLVLRRRREGLGHWMGVATAAVALLVTYLALDRGIPAYRLHSATTAVETAGGKIDWQATGGVRVDLSGTQLDDAALKQLADRLRATPCDRSVAGGNERHRRRDRRPQWIDELEAPRSGADQDYSQRHAVADAPAPRRRDYAMTASLLSPGTPLICVEQITKRFPGVTALDGVTFDVREGEFHAVVGENGAGKSTLMKILSGVITDFEGTLRIAGRDVRFASTRKAEEAGIAIIHQELNLVEDLSAAANVFLGREKRSALGLLDDRAMQRAAGDPLQRARVPHPPGTVGTLTAGRRSAARRDRQGTLAGRVNNDHG